MKAADKEAKDAAKEGKAAIGGLRTVKTAEKEVKDAIKEGKIAIGTRTAMKLLKNDKLSLVLYASNCPETTRKDLNHYASLSKTEIKGLEDNSIKLGEMCGKPFNVLLIGIKK